MTNLTKFTIVFVSVLEKCHEGSAKPEEWSTGPLDTACKIDVENIHESWMRASTMNCVHNRRQNQERRTLGICESVITFQSRKTIDLKLLSTRAQAYQIPQMHIVDLSQPQPEDISW